MDDACEQFNFRKKRKKSKMRWLCKWWIYYKLIRKIYSSFKSWIHLHVI